MSNLEKIFNKLHTIDITLAAQHESLKDHMRRTELLEKDLEPVKKHVFMVNGAIKLISIIGVLAAIIEVIHVILK